MAAEKSSPNPQEAPTPAVPEQSTAPRDATRPEKETIVYLNLSELRPFKNHPFGIRDEAEMQGLVESVRASGVNRPALLRSQNNQRVGRELMTPSELATMPGDRCILQLRGLPPFYSRKYDLKQHPNYRLTAESDKVKIAFDLDRLINHRRRPGLNEAFEVYEVDVPAESLTDEDILNYDDLDDPDAFV